MGRIARSTPDGVTTYYWYPGDKAAWRQAAIAVVAGGVTFLVARLASGSGVWSAVLGTSVSLAVAGAAVGRRDARALWSFPDIVAARGAAVRDTLRAVMRALVRGLTGVGAALLVAHLPPRGVVADWVLPAVPLVVGVVAHQAGMIYERVAYQSYQSSDDSSDGDTLELTPADDG